MTTFRLAHISDLHLPPPAGVVWRHFAPKRLVSRIAWRRKGPMHSPTVLAAIAADLKAQAPDHVAITGDLTNFATPEEYERAQAWLREFGDAADVTVSPGNHDALAGETGVERFAPWRPWLGDDEGAFFPKVRRRGPVALVNLCSATPTALHLAQGVLGADQIGRLREVLDGLKAEDLCRVILLHHPPAPGVVSRRKSLRDGDALLAVLRETGAELILHGHAHAATVAAVDGPGRRIPVLGVPSASAVGIHYEPARWHGLEIERGGVGWRIAVTARGLDQGGRVGELGRYVLAT